MLATQSCEGRGSVVREACKEQISHGLRPSHGRLLTQAPQKPPSSGKNVASSFPRPSSLPSCPLPPHCEKHCLLHDLCCWLEFDFHMWAVSQTRKSVFFNETSYAHLTVYASVSNSKSTLWYHTNLSQPHLQY